MQIVVYFCSTVHVQLSELCIYCILYYTIRTMILTFPNTYNSLPTDVQAEAIPLILGGGDVLMVNLSEFKMVVYILF